MTQPTTEIVTATLLNMTISPTIPTLFIAPKHCAEVTIIAQGGFHIRRQSVADTQHSLGVVE
jgi:hypothetical protein